MIGDRLRGLRKELKMSQEAVAGILGLQKSAISRYESNKDEPPDEAKITLAKHFNISIDYLLGVIDTPVSYYTEDDFIMLPYKMLADERQLLTEFIGYLAFRKDLHES